MKQLNMYLLTFLMFSLTAIAQGSNRLSEPDFKAANFAKAIEDQKLNGSVFRRSLLRSLVSLNVSLKNDVYLTTSFPSMARREVYAN